MKIVTTPGTITVTTWWGRQAFAADSTSIDCVRVLADKAVPRGLRARLLLALGLTLATYSLRAISLRRGDQAVTLDAYLDGNLDAAIVWLNRHGWEIDAAIQCAIKAPLVRVTVNRSVRSSTGHCLV